MFFIVPDNFFWQKELKVTVSQEFVQLFVVFLCSLDTSAPQNCFTGCFPSPQHVPSIRFNYCIKICRNLPFTVFKMFFMVSNNLFLNTTIKMTIPQDFIQFSVVFFYSLNTSVTLPLDWGFPPSTQLRLPDDFIT